MKELLIFFHFVLEWIESGENKEIQLERSIFVALSIIGSILVIITSIAYLIKNLWN